MKRKQKRRRQTRKITLTEEERKELLKRIRQTKDRKIADRLRVILYGTTMRIAVHWLKVGMEPKASNIVVIGMGYVGIPCAALFADVPGFRVTGIQRRSLRLCSGQAPRSGWKIECLNSGRPPFEGDEPFDCAQDRPGLAELVHRVAVGKGTFRVTDDYAVCRDAAAILIDVQTPTDEDHVPRYESLREVSPSPSSGQALRWGGTFSRGRWSSSSPPWLPALPSTWYSPYWNGSLASREALTPGRH